MDSDILLIKSRLNLSLQASQPTTSKDAAVLILLRGTYPNYEVFLCVRSQGMRKHPGEVCFPGGMWDPTDRDLQHTAVREAEEEVGLSPSNFTLLGSLPSFRARFGIMVHPSVGLLRSNEPFTPLLNPLEVEKVFWTPLRSFLESENHASFVWDNHYTVHQYNFPEAMCYGLTAFISLTVAISLYDTVPQFNISEHFTREYMLRTGTKNVLEIIFSVASAPIDEHMDLYKVKTKL